MERPLPGRSIVGRTSTRSPAIVFQQIALRWSLNPRVLFRSALDCTVLERHVSFKNSDLVTKTTYEPAHAAQLFEGSPEHIQPEIELLSKSDVREITYLRRVHPQADNYPDAFDRCTIDVVNSRYTVTPDMNLSLPPLSFLYGCVHAWGLEYVPLSPEAAQKLADELVAQKLALEEKKRRAKEEKVAAANAARPAPMPCKHGLACPSKDPRHMSMFTHADDEQRRQSWSKKTKEQSEVLNVKKAKTTVESTPKTSPAPAPLPPDQLPSAMVRMWVDYRAEYVGTNDYNTRIEGVATNFLERFTKFASREVVGGTVYEKFAHFDQLIQKEHFRTTYKRLKEKYAHWVSVFSDDKDNPIKYVYEDIGIAAHLVCLFEIDAKDKGLKEKQSFVDLGCGNGFLVHILNCEGYKGRGIDLKRRKIWDRFGPETGKCLIEVDFHPQDATFPDTDWLVGNHSDELTPWIPYLASKSGPRTNFFVLPCCFHDFDARFQAHRGSLGQYKTYLNYIRSIGETGGFVVETEPLRIPSTKNIALIGRTRSFDPKDPVAAEAIAVKREKLLEGKQVVHMKLRNEREAEHYDSRKRRRETVMTAAKERAEGGATDDNSNSNSNSDNDSDEAGAEAGGVRV